MGLLGDIGRVIIGGVLGGPGGAISVFTVQHGTKVIEGTIDVARQIVKIGRDVYRAIPPEAFALGGDPLHGLLKHEFEDELILLGTIAGDVAIFSGLSWPASGPIGASLAIGQGAVPLYVTATSVVGKLHHRLLNDQEWQMARYIFRDSLYNRDDIILTNLGGSEGRQFVYPISTLGPILVNLGNAYVHDDTTPNGPLLFHELTHVWQAKQRVLREIFLYDTVRAALNEEYEFTPPTPDRQWNEYGTEQQASIVEAWTLGATALSPGGFNEGAHNRFAISSPLFRYINGNVRRSDDRASTSSGRSVRQLLADSGHRTLRDLHPPSPLVWWA
jgi:hypothetical protein